MPSTSKPRTSNSPRVKASLLVLTVVGLGVFAARAGTTSATAATSRSHTVTIENMRFAPAELSVAVGDRVEFKNTDLVPHTATSAEAGIFDSGLIESGKSWSLICDHVGHLSYHCTFHPTMTGVVVVKKD